MMIDILTAIQAAAVIQAPSPVITDIRADAFLEVAPPDQAITMSPRPASDGANGAVDAAVQFAEEVAGVARSRPLACRPRRRAIRSRLRTRASASAQSWQYR
jgi:hypothetical protein